jgi:hypothetical protein
MFAPAECLLEMLPMDSSGEFKIGSVNAAPLPPPVLARTGNKKGELVNYQLPAR